MQTTEEAWASVTLEAEEIACIVPAPEAVIDDADIDIWGEVREGLADAVGVALDQAVFSGIAMPASWPASIVDAATTAGNVATAGTATVEEGGIDDALDLVEADGFDAIALAAKRALRGLLRRPRDSQGQRLADVGAGTVEGVPVSYVASHLRCHHRRARPARHRIWLRRP